MEVIKFEKLHFELLLYYLQIQINEVPLFMCVHAVKRLISYVINKLNLHKM